MPGTDRNAGGGTQQRGALGFARQCRARHETSIGDEAREARLERAEQRTAHRGTRAIGTDDDVGSDADATLEGQGRRAALHRHRPESLPEMDRIRVYLADPLRERVVQIGTMDLVIRCAIALQHLVAAHDLDHRFAGAPVLDAALVRAQSDHGHDVRQTDGVQHMRGIGADSEARTDLAEFERLLEDLRPEAEGLQGARGREARDARADDRNLQFTHVSPAGPCEACMMRERRKRRARCPLRNPHCG